jgi:tRNA-modifying protein YgfZ
MAVHAPPDVQSAYRVLRESAGAVERERAFARVLGPDAVDFLQGQVTNDVAALEPGGGCYALLLNPKGRILADMRILLRTSEELWLDAEPLAMEKIISTLAMFRIGRKVEIAAVPPTERALTSVIGPGARAALAIDAPATEHSWVEGRLDGTAAVAVTTDLGLDVMFSPDDATRVSEALADVERVGEEVAEILRVERGRPRIGVDMSDANLPGELGLEERAVSFTKGCYVGQEPVARMYHRGHPNRVLRGLDLEQPAQSGDPVSGAEKEVGRVGSACISPALGPIALAVLRREAEPGAELTVGNRGSATVVALPFGGV